MSIWISGWIRSTLNGFVLGYPTAFVLKFSIPNFIRDLLHETDVLTLFGLSRLGVSYFAYGCLIDLAIFIFPEIQHLWVTSFVILCFLIWRSQNHMALFQKWYRYIAISKSFTNTIHSTVDNFFEPCIYEAFISFSSGYLVFSIWDGNWQVHLVLPRLSPTSLLYPS